MKDIEDLTEKECPSCDGSGQYYYDGYTFEEYRECKTCKGSGKVKGNIEKSILKDLASLCYSANKEDNHDMIVNSVARLRRDFKLLTAENTKLQEQVERYRDIINYIYEKVEYTEELNMANYNEGLVEDMNNSFIDIAVKLADWIPIEYNNNGKCNKCFNGVLCRNANECDHDGIDCCEVNNCGKYYPDPCKYCNGTGVDDSTVTLTKLTIEEIREKFEIFFDDYGMDFSLYNGSYVNKETYIAFKAYLQVYKDLKIIKE